MFDRQAERELRAVDAVSLPLKIHTHTFDDRGLTQFVCVCLCVCVCVCVCVCCDRMMS